MLQRGRLEDAYLVLVGSRNLARVRAAIERRYSDIVVDSAGDDLDTFEIAGQYYNVASCRVRLWQGEKNREDTVHFNHPAYLSSLSYGLSIAGGIRLRGWGRW